MSPPPELLNPTTPENDVLPVGTGWLAHVAPEFEVAKISPPLLPNPTAKQVATEGHAMLDIWSVPDGTVWGVQVAPESVEALMGSVEVPLPTT
jgi:hypothetical protein